MAGLLWRGVPDLNRRAISSGMFVKQPPHLRSSPTLCINVAINLAEFRGLRLASREYIARAPPLGEDRSNFVLDILL